MRTGKRLFFLNHAVVCRSTVALAHAENGGGGARRSPSSSTSSSRVLTVACHTRRGLWPIIIPGGQYTSTKVDIYIHVYNQVCIMYQVYIRGGCVHDNIFDTTLLFFKTYSWKHMQKQNAFFFVRTEIPSHWFVVHSDLRSFGEVYGVWLSQIILQKRLSSVRDPSGPDGVSALLAWDRGTWFVRQVAKASPGAAHPQLQGVPLCDQVRSGPGFTRGILAAERCLNKGVVAYFLSSLHEELNMSPETWLVRSFFFFTQPYEPFLCYI